MDDDSPLIQLGSPSTTQSPVDGPITSPMHTAIPSQVASVIPPKIKISKKGSRLISRLIPVPTPEQIRHQEMLNSDIKESPTPSTDAVNSPVDKDVPTPQECKEAKEKRKDERSKHELITIYSKNVNYPTIDMKKGRLVY